MSEKISLDNCEFTLKGKRLNSPRSLEALKIAGAEENELLKLTLDQYLKKFPEARSISKELQEERLEHYEDQRKKLLNEIKKIRNDLPENEKNNNNNDEENIDKNDNVTDDINKITNDNNENKENAEIFVDKEEKEEDDLRKNKPEKRRRKKR